MLLGGLSQWTVGLLATFMAVACIIAADVGAYFFGKSWGRTKLTDISPKKTVEGAAGGLLCSTAVALAFSRYLRCSCTFPFFLSCLLDGSDRGCLRFKQVSLALCLPEFVQKPLALPQVPL